MSMAEPVAMVTGSTGAIGEAIARQLAAKGYAVVLAARNAAKAERSAQRIRTAVDGETRIELVDLCRESSVRALHAVGYKITNITDVTPIPHNGCRPPKKRRV